MATLALLPSAALLPEAWLTERLSARRPRHVRLAALRLAKAGGRVVRLPVDAERGC
ncbi:hypothetical protein ACH4MW_09185 [Streptomyces luteogriseus]|uniref:hypothetical protein n=1 Tax=Streptomyces luteogriseus TaxID=68233 RepID=UPI0037A79B27